MRFVVVVVMLLVARGVVSADTPAPPPTELTCRVQTDCPSGAICSQGECIEAPAPITPAPSTPPPVQQPSRPPVPTPTVASPAEAESARMHFAQGAALLSAGNYAAALAELTESYRLRPVAGIHKNIALAQQGLFRYAEAITSLERYLEESQALTLEERGEALELIGEMKALMANIVVTVTPAGATISVDRRPAGTAPLSAPLALAAGTHSLEIAADGYHPERRDITVAAGVAQTVTFALVEIPKTGRVRITSKVRRSTVSIDGKAVGIAPLEIELGTGGHTIEVSAPEHRVYRGELMIAAGQTREVKVSLDAEARPKRWFQKWQVWTPIAAGVAVIAVGLTVNYGTTEDPITGTLQPGVGAIR